MNQIIEKIYLAFIRHGFDIDRKDNSLKLGFENYSINVLIIFDEKTAIEFNKSICLDNKHSTNTLVLLLNKSYESLINSNTIDYLIFENNPDNIALAIEKKIKKPHNDIKVEWSKVLTKIDKAYYSGTSSITLGEKRKDEIINSIIEHIPALKAHREEHNAKISETLVSKDLPAWSRINPTNSETGNRLIIGLQNKTCIYRNNESLGLGCFNCGYYAGVGKVTDINEQQLYNQISKCFIEGVNSFQKFDVIEFLSDGSFLSPLEYTDYQQEYIVQIISQIPFVKRLLIESCPEFVIGNSERLYKMLNILREDQFIEVGIGLETADDFIRTTCINKGFSFDVFTKALKKIYLINSEMNQRLSVVAYLLVKPAFLTEEEAINDTVNSIKKLYFLSESTNTTIYPKLEPAAICNGTILSLLYDSGDYQPLNYWSVLEIITRVYEDKDCRKYLDKIRIGAREDMDDILKIPAIYSNGRLDQYDFIIYHAIQQFNQHHNIFKLYALCSALYPNNIYTLLNDESSLIKWQNEKLTSNSKILKFIENNKVRILYEQINSEIELEITFLKSVFNFLDSIEGYLDDKSYVMDINKVYFSNSASLKPDLARVLNNAFPKNLYNFLNISVVEIEKESDEYLRLLIDINNFKSTKKYSVWSYVPILSNI